MNSKTGTNSVKESKAFIKNKQFQEDELRAWLQLCYEKASMSPDPSTQIGALIVSRSGRYYPMTLSHNRPVQGWEMQESDWERPRKYSLMAHAERQALAKAARHFVNINRGTLVTTWGCCSDCAIQLVESGISRLIRHYPPLDEATERWLESVTIGDQIMKNAEIEVIDIVGHVAAAPAILRGGELFYPGGQEPMV